MAGFIYNNKSTKDILSDELMLATFDEGQITIETNRNIISGDPTISKPIPNEYGMTYDKLIINYGLVKKNGNRFTDKEQEEIEKWLTSPKTSIDLQIYDDLYNDTEIYCGLFTNTKWYSLGEGWIGLMFEFTCNCGYGKKHFKQNLNITSSQAISINNPLNEEYIYPTITLLQSSNTDVMIKNISDNNNSMNFKIKSNSETTIDCQHCILKNQSGLMSYEELGWDNVENIYWLRLLPGDNQISVSGASSMAIEFDYPCKKLGGWRL